MKTGVRWPYLALLGLLVVVAAGKVIWMQRELALKPGLAYDTERSLLPTFLTRVPAETRAARRAYEQAYAAWKSARPKLAQQPGTPLSAEVRARWAERLTEELIAAWRQGGPTGDQPAVCEQLLRARGALLGDPPDAASLKLARQAIVLPTADPLILAVAGELLARGGKQDDPTQPADAVRALMARGCSPGLTCWLATRSVEPSTIQTLRAQALRGPFEPGDQRLLLALSPVPSANGLYDQPGIDLWLLHMLAAAEQQRNIRPDGSGPADAEPPQTIARRHLLLAWHLHPDWPEAATELISLAMAFPESPDEARFWFDQAVARQLDYAPAYAALRGANATESASASAPAKPEAPPNHLPALAREIIAAGRCDTGLPAQAWLTIAAAAEAERRGQRVDWSALGSLDELNRCFAGWLAAAASDTERAQVRARWAAVARRLNQPSAALAALAGGRAYDDSSEYDQVSDDSPTLIAGWAAAATELGQAATEADTCWREQRWADAAARYGALVANAKADAREFVQRRAATAAALSRWSAGQTVDIGPVALPEAWQIRSGRVTPSGQGPRLTTTEPATMTFIAPLRAPFGLRGAAVCSSGAVQPGVVVTGWSDDRYRTLASDYQTSTTGPAVRSIRLSITEQSIRAATGYRVGPDGKAVRGDDPPALYRLSLRSADCPMIYPSASTVRADQFRPDKQPKPYRLAPEQVWWSPFRLILGPAVASDDGPNAPPAAAPAAPAAPATR